MAMVDLYLHPAMLRIRIPTDARMIRAPPHSTPMLPYACARTTSGFTTIIGNFLADATASIALMMCSGVSTAGPSPCPTASVPSTKMKSASEMFDVTCSMPGVAVRNAGVADVASVEGIAGVGNIAKLRMLRASRVLRVLRTSPGRAFRARSMCVT
eukprot:360996-Chlamydomonas_euryale.AAC.4